MTVEQILSEMDAVEPEVSRFLRGLLQDAGYAPAVVGQVPYFYGKYGLAGVGLVASRLLSDNDNLTGWPELYAALKRVQTPKK
ncbi:MAG: hypothetical protein UZ15_CFX003000649 [Chloroflexi bacterium OLB15]|nr:MAG: hypothetical protein UZ15_CFX003000649 [Chloroflexi bacterium OLB15]